jgi:hypothetical protein
VGFNVTDQLLIRFCIRKLQDILIEFGVPMKLVRLIKMCSIKHVVKSM